MRVASCERLGRPVNGAEIGMSEAETPDTHVVAVEVRPIHDVFGMGDTDAPWAPPVVSARAEVRDGDWRQGLVTVAFSMTAVGVTDALSGCAGRGSARALGRTEGQNWVSSAGSRSTGNGAESRTTEPPSRVTRST